MRMLLIEIWIYPPCPPFGAKMKRWHIFLDFPLAATFFYSVSGGEKEEQSDIFYYLSGFYSQLFLAGYRAFFLEALSPKFFSFLSRVKCDVELCKGRLLALGFLYQFLLLLPFLCALFFSVLYSIVFESWWLGYLLWSLQNSHLIMDLKFRASGYSSVTYSKLFIFCEFPTCHLEIEWIIVNLLMLFMLA